MTASGWREDLVFPLEARQVRITKLVFLKKNSPALEATQGPNDSFSIQLPYKCYLAEVAPVGD